jgi:hypothetical protein
MYAMSTWALATMTLPRFRSDAGLTLPADPVPWAGLVLLVLAVVMLVEAIRVIALPQGPGGPSGTVRTSRLPEPRGWDAKTA